MTNTTTLPIAKTAHNVPAKDGFSMFNIRHRESFEKSKSFLD